MLGVHQAFQRTAAKPPPLIFNVRSKNDLKKKLKIVHLLSILKI